MAKTSAMSAAFFLAATLLVALFMLGDSTTTLPAGFSRYRSPAITTLMRSHVLSADSRRLLQDEQFVSSKALEDAATCVAEFIESCPQVANTEAAPNVAETVSSYSGAGNSGNDAIIVSKEEYDASCNGDCKADYEKFMQCFWDFTSILIEAAAEAAPDSSSGSLEDTKLSAAKGFVICKCDYPPSADCLSKEAESFVAASAGSNPI
jgi:hypothetical protein